MKSIRGIVQVIPLLAFLALGTTACEASTTSSENDQDPKKFAELPADTAGLAVATFAGGCFWCTEAVFERLKGVKYVISGYAGGQQARPTYREVSYGETTHAESIQVYYEPSVINFSTLLEVFFKAAHDPTQVNRQGPDVGPQYRSVAFYRTEDEKQAITQFIDKLERSNYFSKPIATEVTALTAFYPAEVYHQDYYRNNPNDRYIVAVAVPKVRKFEEKFPGLLQ